ncbi:MAG: NAD-dependent epimerase/dehydratase family protein [Elusimicrobiota bacterium]
MIDGKTIAVTGAPGWLGTRLVEALRGAEGGWPKIAGARVRCLVQPGVDSSPLTALGADVVEADLSRPGNLSAALDGVEIVLHLAGLVHPKRISELYALNTEGTKRLLEASAAAKVRRFVAVSSNSAAGVNADPVIPLDESAQDPYMNYGRSKLLAEQAVMSEHASGVVEGVVVRPCWFYGPGQPARQTRFFKMIAAGNPILFGTGDYLRSMSYVDNTVQGLILAAGLPRAAGQIYWIADERPYAVNEIYCTIARLLDVKDFRPRRVPETVSRACRLTDEGLQAAGLYVPEVHVAGELIESISCTIDKARRELAYRPLVSLEEGMRRSIDWCRARGLL